MYPTAPPPYESLSPSPQSQPLEGLPNLTVSPSTNPIVPICYQLSINNFHSNRCGEKIRNILQKDENGLPIPYNARVYFSDGTSTTIDLFQHSPDGQIHIDGTVKNISIQCEAKDQGSGESKSQLFIELLRTTISLQDQNKRRLSNTADNSYEGESMNSPSTPNNPPLVVCSDALGESEGSTYLPHSYTFIQRHYDIIHPLISNTHDIDDGTEKQTNKRAYSYRISYKVGGSGSKNDDYYQLFVKQLLLTIHLSNPYSNNNNDNNNNTNNNNKANTSPSAPPLYTESGKVLNKNDRPSACCMIS